MQMTTTLGWLREIGSCWQDAGQTDSDPSLTDLTPVTVYSDGSVEVVGGGVLVDEPDEEIAAAAAATGDLR